MGIALLITSWLMVNLYTKYCDYLHYRDPQDQQYDDYPEKCGENESHFIVLPFFGFSTMAAWVR